MRTGWVALLGALICLGPAVVMAEPASTTTSQQLDAARALAEAGLQLFERGDYPTALERFRDAEKIVHAPPHLLYIARALERTGKLVEARGVYERLAADDIAPSAPPAFLKSQQQGKAELEALVARIPTIRIVLPAAGAEQATVLLDGSPIDRAALADPVPVDPGEHTLELRAPGAAPTSRTITVTADDRELAVELGAGASGDGSSVAGQESDGAPAAGASFAGPLVLLGVGVAGLGVGIVTGVLTLNDASELKERCPQNPCPPDNESLADSVHTLGTVSTVGFIAGGAVAGAGLVWLAIVAAGSDGELGSEEPASDATEPAPETTLHVSPLVGVGFFGMRGQF